MARLIGPIVMISKGDAEGAEVRGGVPTLE